MSRLPFGNGFTSINRLREEMDRAFNRVFQETAGFVPRETFPPVNVWEDDNNLYLEAELPGITMENLEILVKDLELTISGDRGAEASEGVVYHRRERGQGRFSRTLNLPMPIDADKVEATLKDGVLSLTLPKAEEAKPRKIEVKTA